MCIKKITCSGGSSQLTLKLEEGIYKIYVSFTHKYFNNFGVEVRLLMSELILF